MKNALSAFEAFYAESGATPGNAARLAAEDHAAQGIKNWAYIDALREAGRLSDATPDLMAENEANLACIENLLGDIKAGRMIKPECIAEGLTIRRDKTRAAIAKAKGTS